MRATEETVQWFVRQFEISIRQMLEKRQQSHAFDFDGTTNGQKRPWTCLIVLLPKDQFERMEAVFGTDRDAKESL